MDFVNIVSEAQLLLDFQSHIRWTVGRWTLTFKGERHRTSHSGQKCQLGSTVHEIKTPVYLCVNFYTIMRSGHNFHVSN